MSADISTREGLFAVMRQIKAEREAAKPLVAELMSREQLPWDEEIPEEWRTAGFVEELTKAAYEAVERNPPQANDLLRYAIAILSSVHNGQYPTMLSHHQNAESLRKLGWVQTFGDTFAISTRTLEAAHAHISSSHASHYLRARIAESAATNSIYALNYESAHRNLPVVEAIYRELGDEMGLIRVEVLRASIDYYGGRYEEVTRRLERVADSLPPDCDDYTVAMLSANIAAAYLRLGQTGEVYVYADRARRAFENILMPTDRVDVLIGRAKLVDGQVDDARSLLQRVRDAFLVKSMPEEAGLVGLDLVDILVALDKTEEARNLAEQIAHEFRLAGLDFRATTAVNYLRDLLPQRKHESIGRQVREFIEESRQNPTLQFSPLSEI